MTGGPLDSSRRRFHLQNGGELDAHDERKPTAAEYGLASCALVVAVFLRWLLDPFMGNSLPLATVFAAVALSAWRGGYRPAVLVTVAGYLTCAYLFIEPRGAVVVDPRNLIGLGAYLFTCSIIIALGEATRRAQFRLAKEAAAARERADLFRITLASVGDAVITTDAAGLITSMNPVSQALTGWTQSEAVGQPMTSVFNIINEYTDEPVENPVASVLKQRQVVALANHTLLIAKDGKRCPIEDTAAPIIDDAGTLVGAVLVFHDVSARREAENHRLATFAENTRLLELNRAIVANMGEGLYTVDTQGLVTYINPAAERMFGWDSSELIGRKMHDITHYKHPDGTPFLIAECAGFKVLHEGQVLVDYEDVFIRKDGSFFPVACCSSPLQLGETKLGLVVVFRDTTAKRVAEQALSESEKRFRAAMDAVQGVLWTNTAEGEMRGEQPGWAALTGQAFDDYQGLGWAKAVHPDDARSTIDAWLEAVKEKRLFMFEHRVRRHDGQWRRFSIRGIPILNADGSIREWVGVHTDITESLMAQEALRTSESRLRELNVELERRVIERTQARGKTWQLSPDLLGALNSNGYFETSNPAWQTILGWSEAEVASTSIFKLLHPDDLLHTRAGFELTQVGQPAMQFVNRYRCKDGSYRWISWVGIPEDDLVYCTGRDITAERAAELELSEAQEALRQSQKMEAIGQLTGGIAHDFNNLLTGIIGALDVIRKRMAANRLDDIPRFLDVATSCARSAGALTHRLLAFARRQSLDPRPNHVNRLVKGMEDLLSRTLGEEVELQCRLAEELWTAFIDANQLENAVLNLAINARDAMPEGGLLMIETLNVQVQSTGAVLAQELVPGDYVVVSVSDTGTGMSPEVLAKAVEPFFTTKPVGEGTGLGLAVISGFVKQSGGYLDIHSEIGQGTTVKLYLPRSLQDVIDTELVSLDTPRGGGETILIVEDNDTVRTILSDALRDLGYTIMEASDARPAIALLNSIQKIDLLISDVILPHINGRKLAEIAKTARPDLKILFITGHAGNALVQADLLQPGIEMMTKPFALDALGDKVRLMITSKECWQ